MHQEYIRYVAGSRFAVLLIHGIVGTPRHFDALVPVIPEEWSVYNILLDGHGKTVADFGASSMKKWKTQVKAQLAQILERHEKVLIVGHSMGTLFAIQAAIDHPDQIAELFLLAVPLRPWVRVSTMLTCLRVLGPIREGDVAAAAMKKAAGTMLESNPFKYLCWLPRFVELLAECRRAREMLPKLTVPAQCFQSRVDELVSMRTCAHLEGHPAIRNTVLEDSGHFVYGDGDMELLRRKLAQTIARLEG